MMVAPNPAQMRDRRFIATRLRNRYNDGLAGSGQSWKSLSDILPNPGGGFWFRDPSLTQDGSAK
jgi:hypothetical protein